MIKINDKKLYFYFSIITFILGIILGIIFTYSAFIVEPEIRELLSLEDNINENYKKAYLILRDPQIFARYENFDRKASSIKSILKAYDERINNNENFVANDKIYLERLLDRRERGSLLTRNTMIFFFLLTLLGLIFYFFERYQNIKSGS